MKFSISSFPFLKLIEEKQLSRLKVRDLLDPDLLNSQKEDLIRHHCEQGEKFIKMFTKLDYKISYFTKSIREQIDQIGNQFARFVYELPDCKGVFLLKDGNNNILVFYTYERELHQLSFIDTQGTAIQSMGFVRHFAAKEHMEAYEQIDNKSLTPSQYENLIKKLDKFVQVETLPEPDLNDPTNSGPVDSWRGGTVGKLVFNHLLFYHLVETEKVVISEAKSFKRKAVVHEEEYSTQTRLPIEIVDSNWFRTISRIKGFTVSGHLRLQPVGVKRGQRKLIWINEYEKHGYNLPSKKDG